jgi:peptidoglycan hydrolase CwlO-like protein
MIDYQLMIDVILIIIILINLLYSYILNTIIIFNEHKTDDKIKKLNNDISILNNNIRTLNNNVNVINKTLNELRSKTNKLDTLLKINIKDRHEKKRNHS